MARATITLNLPLETLKAFNDDLLARKRALLDELDDINVNLTAIAKAIGATQERKTLVISEKDKFKSYMVSLLGDLYKCTCPSYEFSTGLDYMGHCKHIRKVIDEGRFA